MQEKNRLITKTTEREVVFTRINNAMLTMGKSDGRGQSLERLDAHVAGKARVTS